MLITKIHTGKLNKSQKILTKNKHYILSAKAYNLDPWISEPRLTEKLLHLKVNLGFIISWKMEGNLFMYIISFLHVISMVILCL